MSKQNIEIEVPDGYKAKYNPETQKIEMIKKNGKPKSLKDFYEMYRFNEDYYITTDSIIERVIDGIELDPNSDRNIIHSKEEAEAFLALMQLRLLRRVWIGDWEADWNDSNNKKYAIRCWRETPEVGNTFNLRRSLSFPTKEMAEEFLECFKDLIEKAKILL